MNWMKTLKSVTAESLWLELSHTFKLLQSLNLLENLLNSFALAELTWPPLLDGLLLLLFSCESEMVNFNCSISCSRVLFFLYMET